MEKIGTIKVKNVVHNLFELNDKQYPTTRQFLKKVHSLSKECIIKTVYRRIPDDNFDEQYGIALICPKMSIKEEK